MREKAEAALVIRGKSSLKAQVETLQHLVSVKSVSNVFQNAHHIIFPSWFGGKQQECVA